MQYISSSNFAKFLENLKNDYIVYIPVKKNDQYFYEKYIDFADDIVIGEVRAFEPLKSFFFRAREIVAENFKSDIPQKIQKPYCIVGVKACDLKGLQIQDYVFENHDYQDPFYIDMRKNNLIISADCTSTIDTCFCLALNVKPYPLENFDINLSVVGEDFVVEVGSQKGKILIEKYSSLFEEVKEEFISQRDKQRKKVIKRVEENIKQNDIPHQDSFKNIIERGYESNIWADEANNCVECGACNTICPTCHCFLLYDQKSENKMARCSGCRGGKSPSRIMDEIEEQI